MVGSVHKKIISGGERKRTAIGVELITDPSIILLDEPTSGLDSFMAKMVCNLLKDLAEKQGKTIIATIH
jgi:ATP-binding cassette, subfamily G (WHITE), eye pigment precursor transporter